MSNNLLNTSPRLSFPGLYADLYFSLLTYAFSLCNYASSVVSTLEDYEKQLYASEEERKANDEKLNTAVNFLCRGSGMFTYLAETVLPELVRGNSPGESTSIPRVPDVSKEVLSALSK